MLGKPSHKKFKSMTIKNVLRILLGVTICSILIFTIYIGKPHYGDRLREGDISLRNIYASMDFSYEAGVDQEKTQKLRQESMGRIKDVYDLDPKVTTRISEEISRFFNKVLDLRKVEGISEQERETMLREELKQDLSSSNLRLFIQNNKLKNIEKEILRIIIPLEEKGILDTADKEELIKTNKERIVVRDIKLGLKEEKDVVELLTVDDAKEKIRELSQNLFPEDRKLRIAAIELIRQFIKPSLTFNQGETLRLRQEARELIPVQHKEIEVKKEELIIAKGQRVTSDHLVLLKELEKREIKVNKFFFIFGVSLLVVTFLTVISIYLKFFESKVFSNNRNLLLISLISVVIVIVAKVIVLSPLPSYFIPTSIASMSITMLIGPNLALIITVILSLFVGITAGYNLSVIVVSLVGGIVGIYSVVGVRRRSHLLSAGVSVGIANFACIASIGFLHNLEYSILIKESFWGFINGIISSVIVTAILPTFEYMFKIITNISLLELSDLNHPLLKEMVNKAPGTYHHSLVVANIAETTCEAIGANALLAKVGSYYHDIGKIGKAEYFSENQKDAKSRQMHDKLTPTMSRLIITNHVKDGVELSRKYKLNKAIVDFIEQHHGTGLIFYFYQRALEKLEDKGDLEEEGFRYSGPKPQTKETAIVLLADSVEAASRALSDPTPSRIKGLVRKIINNKFIDNQLDECELTLKDLNKIADTFIRILTGMFHSRVEYPSEGEGAEVGRQKTDDRKQMTENRRQRTDTKKIL